VVENVFQLESKKFFFSDDVNECFMSFALGFCPVLAKSETNKQSDEYECGEIHKN
jgi:hypothetical protein